MFKYLGNITDLSHYIIENFVDNKGIALDGTLGNGGDCDFLSKIFDKVYAFDIQNEVIENYRNKNIHNVNLILDSHSNVKKHIKEQLDVAIFNLGFLPGGNKNITTMVDSTLKAIEDTLSLIKSGSILIIVVYPGHGEGKKESDALLNYTKALPKNEFGVMIHKVINRSEYAPYMLVIEKK